MILLSKFMPVRPFTLNLAQPQPRRWAPIHYSWICPGNPQLDKTIRVQYPQMPVVVRFDLASRITGIDNSLAPLN